MLRRRLFFYFGAAAALTLAATIVGEAFLIERVVEHSRRADSRFADGVANHVAISLEQESRHLVALLAQLPFEKGEAAVRDYLQHEPESTFEQGGIAVFSSELWAAGAGGSAADLAPRELLLPALRAARKTGKFAVTSLWEGADGKPRVTLVTAIDAGPDWRAAVGNIRLDGPAFLSHFGFFPRDEDVRLQILDAAGVALFSTAPAERYHSAVHGTYLLDRVRQGESTQLKCHTCHEGPGGTQKREEEISTLAPVQGTPWSVLVHENPAQMQQVLIETMTTVVVLVCMILGAFTGFYWLLTRRVLRPLRQLAHAAAAVSAATPSNQPPIRPGDEMQVLAQSFEAMLSQVSASGQPSSAKPTTAEPAPAPAAPPDLMPAAPGELRETLQSALTTAVEGFRSVEIVSAILVTVEGEVLGGPPLVVGTAGAATAELATMLARVSAGRDHVTRDELGAAGVDLTPLPEIDTFYRSELRVLHLLHGELWVGSNNPDATRHLKPVSVLITLHVQGILDRTLLSDTLWHEYREKSRMLGHLFDSEAEERKRIAREIHDDTAQALTALMLLLETFPVGASAEAQEAAIRTAQDRVSRIIDSTDRIMKRLRPALLDDLGLVDAVRALGEDVLTSGGVDFELDAPEQEIGAAPELEDALFRVFQEAASNVIRHAHANNVSASLEVTGGQIVGSFEDDGTGMQPHAQQPAEVFSDRPRFGLLGMRERITQLGGSFKLSTSESGGLRIDVAVPFRAAARTHGGERGAA